MYELGSAWNHAPVWAIFWQVLDHWLIAPRRQCIYICIHKLRGQNKWYKPQNCLSHYFTNCTQVLNKQHAFRARFQLDLSGDWQPQKASESPTFTSTHLHQTTDYSVTRVLCRVSVSLRMCPGRQDEFVEVIFIHSISTQISFSGNMSPVLERGGRLKRKDRQLHVKGQECPIWASTHPNQNTRTTPEENMNIEVWRLAP